MMDPQVTFFLNFGNGERGRASGLSGAVGGPAGVPPRVLGESVHYDERGGACCLFKVKDHVFGGLNGLLLMKPLNVWFRHARHAGMEAGHRPVCCCAAPDWLNEKGLLASGGRLHAGEAGGDGPLRQRFAGRSDRLS